MLYSFLDFAFLVGHSILIVFNLFGWAWHKTRNLHLLSILVTAASWVALAPWFGLGYCPCTDWHWQIKETLGQTDLPNNYLTYLFDAWLGLEITDASAERLAYLCLTPALVVSIYLNLRDRHKTSPKLKETERDTPPDQEPL